MISFSATLDGVEGMLTMKAWTTSGVMKEDTTGANPVISITLDCARNTIGQTRDETKKCSRRFYACDHLHSISVHGHLEGGHF